MRKVTVSYSFRDTVSVPMIRLRGKWLQLAGFEKGRLVHIEVEEGRMTLTIGDDTPGGKLLT